MEKPYLHYPFETKAAGRLDVAVTEELKSYFKENSPTRSRISKWIDDSLVKVDGKAAAKAGLKVKEGQYIEVLVPPLSEELNLEPDPSIELKKIFEDQHLLVLDKQAGLVVHPGAGVQRGTLVNALVAAMPEEFKTVGHPMRPGIVHRLDKDTSGLMVVAKTENAYQNLIQQFQPPRTISRTYLAVTEKLPNIKSQINTQIRRSQSNRLKMEAVLQGGKDAGTLWEVESELNGLFILRLKLTTGRTHQIRVHLEYTKAPIVGEKLYNRGLSQKFPFPRQALHASELSFKHVETGEELSFKSELPEDIRGLIEGL